MTKQIWQKCFWFDFENFFWLKAESGSKQEEKLKHPPEDSEGIRNLKATPFGVNQWRNPHEVQSQKTPDKTAACAKKCSPKRSNQTRSPLQSLNADLGRRSVRPISLWSYSRRPEYTWMHQAARMAITKLILQWDQVKKLKPTVRTKPEIRTSQTALFGVASCPLKSSLAFFDTESDYNEKEISSASIIRPFGSRTTVFH